MTVATYKNGTVEIPKLGDDLQENFAKLVKALTELWNVAPDKACPHIIRHVKSVVATCGMIVNHADYLPSDELFVHVMKGHTAILNLYDKTSQEFIDSLMREMVESLMNNQKGDADGA